MMQNFGISVIIPTYNREQFVKQTIDSVIAQNYTPIEIIVSDDGSTDNTIGVVKKFGDKVKIILKPPYCHNQGSSGTRNRGILASTQPYICFLDSDDYLLPGHLIKMMNIFSTNSEIGFTFCRIAEIRTFEQGDLMRKWSFDKITPLDIKHPVVTRHKILQTNGFLLKMEVFEVAGLFKESYKMGEDGDMWMRISELFEGAFSDHYGIAYRSLHNFAQQTRIDSKIIKDAGLLIFMMAAKRFKKLGLKDSFRIFQINYHIMHLEKTYTFGGKIKHYLKFLKNIMSHPKGLIPHLYLRRLTRLESKIPNNWEDEPTFFKKHHIEF
jgi:glycosyltransferase involved in cell wall biosynthesis